MFSPMLLVASNSTEMLVSSVAVIFSSDSVVPPYTVTSIFDNVISISEALFLGSA